MPRSPPSDIVPDSEDEAKNRPKPRGRKPKDSKDSKDASKDSSKDSPKVSQSPEPLKDLKIPDSRQVVEPSPTPSFLDGNLSDLTGYTSSSSEKPSRPKRERRQIHDLSNKRRLSSEEVEVSNKRRKELSDSKSYKRDGVTVPAGLENPFRRTPSSRLDMDEMQDLQSIREGVGKSGREEFRRARSKTPAKELWSPKRTRKQKDSVDENDDHCSTCRGTTGDLLCCDFCPKSFHAYCCDPPVDVVPEGQWACRVCRLRKNPDPSPPFGQTPFKRGLFTPLFEKLNSQPVKIFKLPPSISNAFANSARNPATGDYIDLTDYKVVPRFHGNSQQNMVETLRKEASVAICFKCCKSGGLHGGGNADPTRSSPQYFGYLAGTQPTIIKCDYCPLWWHLDCLDPPLTHLVNVGTFPLDEPIHEGELGHITEPKRGRKQILFGDVAQDDRRLHELAFSDLSFWTDANPPTATTGQALGLRRRWMCPCHSEWEQRKVDVQLDDQGDVKEPDTGSTIVDEDQLREEPIKLFPRRHKPHGPLTIKADDKPTGVWNRGEIRIENDEASEFACENFAVNDKREWAKFIVDDHEFSVMEARVKMEFLNKCQDWKKMKGPKRELAMKVDEFLARYPDEEFELHSNVENLYQGQASIEDQSIWLTSISSLINDIALHLYPPSLESLCQAALGSSTTKQVEKGIELAKNVEKDDYESYLAWKEMVKRSK